MVLALEKASMTSGGCARQFWHGQGCPEVVRYQELGFFWPLSERKPLEWCDFRVVVFHYIRVFEYIRDYAIHRTDSECVPSKGNRPSAGTRMSPRSWAGRRLTGGRRGLIEIIY